jgi:hypothetical protein
MGALHPVQSPAASVAESVMGISVGAFENEVPPGWGVPRQINHLSLEQEPFKVALYSNGVVLLSQDKEILMIIALEGYAGASTRGITIGSTATDILARYKHPSRILDMTQGEAWL